jgi:hypothetical protein
VADPKAIPSPPALAEVRRVPAYSMRRIWLARGIAAVADFIQIVGYPAFIEGVFSPFNDVLDVVVAVLMVWLLGWHIAFLPTIFIKSLPVVDVAPSWTLAVFIVTRGKQMSQIESSVKP